MKRFDRRQFGTLLGATALELGLSSCAAQSTKTRLSALAELKEAVRGPVLSSTTPGYAAARTLVNAAVPDRNPVTIVQCLAPSDAKVALRFAQEHDLPLTVRSGGHSYTGASACDGMMIDLRHLDRIEIDERQRRVRIEAGARLGAVYEALGQHQLGLPLGTCPTVGVSGFTLGGGKGFSTRRWGLATDRLRAVEWITARGTHIRCTADEHPDLFWASRGGGGGRIGIAVAFEFEAVPTKAVACWTATWPLERATRLIEAWQKLAPHAPDDLFIRLQLGRHAGGADVTLFAQYFGDRGDLEKHVVPLIEAAGTSATESLLEEGSFQKAALRWAGCSEPGLKACLQRIETENRQARSAWAAKSDYFDRPLSTSHIEGLVTAFQRAAPALAWQGIQLDPMNGAESRIPRTESAFVHRKALFCAQYLAYWPSDASSDRIEAHRNWLTHLKTELSDAATGESYQNYLDPELTHPTKAYFAENAPRLLAVQRRYDPQGIFQP